MHKKNFGSLEIPCGSTHNNSGELYLFLRPLLRNSPEQLMVLAFGATYLIWIFLIDSCQLRALPVEPRRWFRSGFAQRVIRARGWLDALGAKGLVSSQAVLFRGRLYTNVVSRSMYSSRRLKAPTFTVCSRATSILGVS